MSHRALALALLFGASGCGGGKPVKVQGRVTLDGRPVAAATVSFIPEGGNGRPASGLTDSDGVFKLTTARPNDGAIPGDYLITVSRDQDRSDGGATSKPAMDPAELTKTYARLTGVGTQMKAGMRPAKQAIPSGYGHPQKSGLKCRVPLDGPLELELTSKWDSR